MIERCIVDERQHRNVVTRFTECDAQSCDGMALESLSADRRYGKHFVLAARLGGVDQDEKIDDYVCCDVQYSVQIMLLTDRQHYPRP